MTVTPRKHLVPIDMDSNKITNLGAPTAAGDATTKTYVDGLVNGTKWHAPADLATTGAITLSGEQTIDNVMTNASRVLVKNQGTPSQNGIYLSGAGAWVRVEDLPAGADAANVTVFVQKGDTLADTQWTCTANTGAATVGTHGLAWQQIGSGTSYSADNSTLQLVGSTFSIKNGGVGNTQLAAGAALSNIGAGGLADSYLATAPTHKYAADIGNGSDSEITVTHNLGTRDVVVSVHDKSTYAEVYCGVIKNTTNAVILSFSSAPASNAYRVIVIG